MRRWILLLSVLLTAIASAAPKDWPKSFKFAIIPVEGGLNVKERFDLFKIHMEKSMGIKVELFIVSDYNGIITAMTHKSVDAAYFGFKFYVEAVNRADVEVLALELNKSGKPGYNGIIIVRSDSKYKKIEDTKGADFAFTDPNSMSGYLVFNILFL